MEKKKMGRPRLLDTEKKGSLIAVRLLGNEEIEIERAIAESGKKKADWLREAVLAKARQG